MTVTAKSVVRPPSTRFQELFDSLNKREKEMYGALKQDAKRAEKLNKPFLGLFNRRGQHRFVILRESCEFERDYEKACRHRSSLSLSDEDVVSFGVINKLLCLLKLEGFRTNGLVQYSECLRHGVDSVYFEYRIDLEAA